MSIRFFVRTGSRWPLAAASGYVRAANFVLLGALSALMERAGLGGPALTAETWLAEIEARVPAKYRELNRRAFEAGREAAVDPFLPGQGSRLQY